MVSTVCRADSTIDLVQAREIENGLYGASKKRLVWLRQLRLEAREEQAQGVSRLYFRGALIDSSIDIGWHE
jgi:hypothetical protein